MGRASATTQCRAKGLSEATSLLNDFLESPARFCSPWRVNWHVLTWSLLCFAGTVRPAESPVAATPPAPALDYFLIVTGGELLRGIYPDRHTHFVTGVLEPLGGHCVGSWSVDDVAPDLTEALRYATAKAPVVLVTGGLGPTDDDITRETVAAFTGIPLKEHPDVLADMAKRYNVSRDEIQPNLRRQAQVPERGTYLKNPGGSAVGLVFDAGTNTVVALPGPPRELHAMMTNEVVPYLQRHFALRTAGATRTLRFIGIGQSAIYQALHGEIAIEPDVTLTSQFDNERVDVTYSLRGKTPADLARRDEIERRVRHQLGDFIYATDGSSLEETVLRALKNRGLKLVILDAATGGLLYANLALGRDAAAVLACGWAAPSEESLLRVLGTEAAMTDRPGILTDRFPALAKAARDAAAAPASLVLVIGQPTKTASGEATITAVWTRGDAPPVVVELRGSGSTDASRTRIASDLLNRLRQHLAKGD